MTGAINPAITPPADEWDDPRPFAERAWHTCSGCRYNENRSVGGSPPWGECTLFRWPDQHRNKVNGGRDCNRYAPHPWVIAP